MMYLLKNDDQFSDRPNNNRLSASDCLSAFMFALKNTSMSIHKDDFLKNYIFPIGILYIITF